MLPNDAPAEIAQAYNAATEKQRALAIALASGMGKEESMLAAGYSKRQSKKCEVADHPRVVKIATWLGQRAIEKEADKVERAIERMADIATFDVKDTYGPDGKMLPPNEWPEAARKAFSGFDAQGNPKFWSPIDAAEKLFKVKGTYAPEKHVHDVNPLVKLVEEVMGAAVPVVSKDPDHG